MPFYVSPEQVMKDRADYARKGIARGRSLVAISAVDGIVIVAENPSRTLYKISEIYDRIAFAGVGKYNEFEMLRIAGVRQADLKGYSFAREDVNARVARQRVRADARPGLHPRDEAVRGRDPRRRRSATTAERRRAVPHPLRRHGDGRGGLHRARRPGRHDRRGARRPRYETGIDARRRDPLGADVLAGADNERARRRPARGRVPRPGEDAGAFRRVQGPELEAVLAD